MTKTEEIIKLLNSGETDVKVLKEKTGASDSTVSRVKAKWEASNNEPAKEATTEEPEPTDEEIDSIIKRVKITPEQKYFTGQEEPEEEYHCMGCDHRWNSKKIPTSCPKCGSEF